MDTVKHMKDYVLNCGLLMQLPRTIDKYFLKHFNVLNKGKYYWKQM